MSVGFDDGGNLYLATTMVGQIAAPKTFTIGKPGSRDLFVIKISSTHQLVYVSQIGGSAADYLGGMVVDHDGSVFLSGTAGSADFPTTAGTYKPELAIGGSFVLKLDPSGQKLVYSTFIAAFSNATSLAIDSSGAAVVAGWSENPSFPVTDGAYQQKGARGGRSGFVSKISADGSKLVFSTLLSGSTGPDTIAAIALGANGVIQVAGAAISNDFPITPGGNTSSSGDGTARAFYARLDSAGAHLLYSSLLPDYQMVEALALDRNGNAYIAGDRRDGTPGKMRLTKVDPSGQVVYAKAFGGSGGQFTTALLVQEDGEALLGGFAYSPDFPTRDSLMTCNQTTYGDFGVVLALDAGGNVTHSSLLGGGGENQVSAIGRDPAGIIHLAGSTTWADFPSAQDLLTSPLSTWLFSFELDLAQVVHGRLAPTCLVLSANYSITPIVPGMVATFFGSNLGPDAGAVFAVGDDGRVPTELAGVRVTVGGVPAPVLYAQDTQINFVIPEQPGGSPDVCVSNGDSQSCISDSTAPQNPGIFGAVLNEDGTINTPANPAPLGSVISVFATGMGPYDRNVPDGSIATEPLALLSAQTGAVFDNMVYCEPFSFCYRKTFLGEIISAGETPGLVAGISQIKVKVPTDGLVGGMGLTITVTPAGGNNPLNLLTRAYTVVSTK
jgi:uncharacterized protein (TIGR03437 family)